MQDDLSSDGSCADLGRNSDSDDDAAGIRSDGGVGERDPLDRRETLVCDRLRIVMNALTVLLRSEMGNPRFMEKLVSSATRVFRAITKVGRGRGAEGAECGDGVWMQVFCFVLPLHRTVVSRCHTAVQPQTLQEPPRKPVGAIISMLRCGNFVVIVVNNLGSCCFGGSYDNEVISKSIEAGSAPRLIHIFNLCFGAKMARVLPS